jgi:aspartate/glutamate racemase
MARIICVHTATSNIVVFDEALATMNTVGVSLDHQVHADLLAAVEEHGELTEAVVARTRRLLENAGESADAVLLTCSTLGPVVDDMGAGRAPVMRVDRALACEAVQGGGRIAVLCAAPTTMQPTRAVFEDAARETRAVVEVQLIAGAWGRFKAGDMAAYASAIATAAHDAIARGVDRVALAQSSMSVAADLCRGAPVLTSPVSALRAAVHQLREKRAGATHIAP